ncbi:MAG: META domain-containing protein [Anaerolineales bacterium]|nr:META domain-containing protein [Anaerolineales bacterium]
MVGYGESPFKRDLVSVENHLWKLVTLNERPPIDNTLLTLQFERFEAAGFGGCNNFRSSYERSGTALNFGFVTSTAKECELPIGVMAQESAYFNAIEQISSFQIENTQFSLIDTSGVERLVYDAVVMGTIHGPENIQLPEDGVVLIHLIDSTLTATEPMEIAVQEIREVPQFPATFSLVYNPKQIIDDHTYVIEVKIEDYLGNLLFINPDVIQVITTGNPSLVNVNIGSPPQ